MLSYKKSKDATPIAVVNGGQHNRDIIYLYDDNSGAAVMDEDMAKYIDDILLKEKGLRCTSRDIACLYRAINVNSDVNLDPKLRNLYDKITEHVKSARQSRDLRFDDGGHLQLLPNPKKRMVIYCAGASGSGKSHFVGNFIKEYMKVFPGHPVYVFSRDEADPALDKNEGIQRILLNETFKDDANPITADDFINSLCIFDDIDTLHDEMILWKIRQLRNDILETGRKKMIYVCTTSHQICDFSKTRSVLLEATHVVFYKGDAHNAQGYLTRYAGQSIKDAKKIMALPSRWICHSRHYPGYLLYDTGIQLID
jgi:hypothetical protein